MAKLPNTLDELRREIDAIDDRLHDLIAQRTAVVRRIAEIKGKGPVLRPGREARILRHRLSVAAGDPLPAAVFARVWRELISAYCRLQGPLQVAVCAPVKSVGYWDLARDHFGSATKMSLFHSATLVLRAVSETEGMVGLLPMPHDDDTDPWWRHLATGPEPALRVVARLPFTANPGARFEDLQAVVVARVAEEDSGDDVSWLVVSAEERISRRSLNDLAQGVDFDAQVLAGHDEGSGAGYFYLLEVAGHVGRDDARLARLTDRLKAARGRVTPVGAYARPQADA